VAHRKREPLSRRWAKARPTWRATPHYYSTDFRAPQIDRQRPGVGYRHLLKKRDVLEFVELLPDWAELSRGLNAIVLATNEGDDTMGYHIPGVVHVCAWEEELWWDSTKREFHAQHRDLLERLGVETEWVDGHLACRWTERQARAFQLLDVLLHELGHHHDRMTTHSQYDVARGESYAEQYAREYGDRIWDAYVDRFGW
jgi:hypothetical protein